VQPATELFLLLWPSADEAPAWVYWFTAASIALYINLDCMDGKQARRTRTSSPLVYSQFDCLTFSRLPHQFSCIQHPRFLVCCYLGNHKFACQIWNQSSLHPVAWDSCFCAHTFTHLLLDTFSFLALSATELSGAED